MMPPRRRIHALLAALLAGTGMTHGAGAEEAAAAGERIYEKYCATCHGDQLQNNSAGLTFDLRRLKADDYPRFVNSVQNGKNTMPPWRGVLGEQQINELWAYIRSSVR